MAAILLISGKLYAMQFKGTVAMFIVCVYSIILLFHSTETLGNDKKCFVGMFFSYGRTLFL